MSDEKQEEIKKKSKGPARVRIHHRSFTDTLAHSTEYPVQGRISAAKPKSKTPGGGSPASSPLGSRAPSSSDISELPTLRPSPPGSPSGSRTPLAVKRQMQTATSTPPSTASDEEPEGEGLETLPLEEKLTFKLHCYSIKRIPPAASDKFIEFLQTIFSRTPPEKQIDLEVVHSTRFLCDFPAPFESLTNLIIHDGSIPLPPNILSHQSIQIMPAIGVSTPIYGVFYLQQKSDAEDENIRKAFITEVLKEPPYDSITLMVMMSDKTPQEFFAQIEEEKKKLFDTQKKLEQKDEFKITFEPPPPKPEPSPHLPFHTTVKTFLHNHLPRLLFFTSFLLTGIAMVINAAVGFGAPFLVTSLFLGFGIITSLLGGLMWLEHQLFSKTNLDRRWDTKQKIIAGFILAFCLALFALGIAFVAGAPLIGGVQMIFNFISQFFITNLDGMFVVSNMVAGLMATGTIIAFSGLVLDTINRVIFVQRDGKPDNMIVDNPSGPRNVNVGEVSTQVTPSSPGPVVQNTNTPPQEQPVFTI